MTTSLLQKIKNKEIAVGIIGLGYVGFPLAAAFAKNGISVVGIDLDTKKIKEIKAGKYVLPEFDTEIYKNENFKRCFSAFSDFNELKDVDVVVVCVPTPLTSAREPDLSYINSAFKAVKESAKKAKLFVLESTTYPGTTRDVVSKILDPNDKIIGKDIHLAFSPERIDPGNKAHTLENTTKIVGGMTSKCSKLAKAFYSLIIENVMEVSSPEVAEMTKLFENIFRCVNIALVNEMAIISDRMDIDVWEVIRAASTKGFGFMPFFPGPGLGGHCIPIDPYYLSWQARNYDYHTEFIEVASKINEMMPHYVVNKVYQALNSRKKSIKGSKVLVLGAAYKKDVDDPRESPAMKIMELLHDNGAILSYYDPFIDSFKVNSNKLFSIKGLTKSLLGKADIVIVITDHTSVDYDLVASSSSLILDTRNVFKNKKQKNIFYLGGGDWSR